ncbi:SDR family NAD(P)-dependent oxidoreductase [Alkalicoccus daliensis]|uniref:Oxidoreductase n=1 Tax=Alkalicoccus daliensis TaxID=745820 RepID=A0A1H0B185_9BACI|nr:SDR family oxidoreductase [Alkalicoccus daliensis]SDN39431.1 hypothetical protein SAMN04488053_101712 [Alkalicoccus daliensis]
MKKNLSEKIVVITGASSGLGEEMALETAHRGGIPVLLARRENKLKALSARIQEETSIYAPCYPIDISDFENVYDVFQEIETHMGKIDVLINNAGFGIFDYVNNASIQDIEEMMKVNVIGGIAAVKAVLPGMLKNQQGHIIFIGSIAGKMATPKSSGYSASKHAVIGFANALRMEVAQQGIKVSTVNPGPIETSFFDRADKEGTYKKSVSKIMMQSEKVAAKTINLLYKPKREINLPVWMGIAAIAYQTAPKIVEWAAGSQFRKK